MTDYFDRLVGRGDWVAGVKLPSERELAARFGTTRGAVRKVVNTFIDRGILRRVRGSGTYVAATPVRPDQSSTAGNEAARVSPSELMEARLLFEPLMPALIVRNATPEDFARMEDCLRQGEQATSNDEFEFWDGTLHKRLAEATHNTLFVSVLSLMTAVREAGEWGRLKQRALTPERRARYEAHHRAIVAALRERDEDLATELMRAHLLEAQSNLFRA